MKPFEHLHENGRCRSVSCTHLSLLARVVAQKVGDPASHLCRMTQSRSLHPTSLQMGCKWHSIGISICNSLLAILDMFAVTRRFRAQRGSVVWGIKSQIQQRSKVVRCLPWLGQGSEAAVICLRPLFVHRAALWDSTIAPARSCCRFLLSPWHIPGTVRFRRVSMG